MKHSMYILLCCHLWTKKSINVKSSQISMSLFDKNYIFVFLFYCFFIHIYFCIYVYLCFCILHYVELYFGKPVFCVILNVLFVCFCIYCVQILIFCSIFVFVCMVKWGGSWGVCVGCVRGMCVCRVWTGCPQGVCVGCVCWCVWSVFWGVGWGVYWGLGCSCTFVLLCS